MKLKPENGTVGWPGQLPIIAGWHVSIDREDGTETLGMTLEFASKRDVEIAIDALQKAGLDTIEKLRAAKPDLRRIMCEALQW